MRREEHTEEEETKTGRELITCVGMTMTEEVVSCPTYSFVSASFFSSQMKRNEVLGTSYTSDTEERFSFCLLTDCLLRGSVKKSTRVTKCGNNSILLSLPMLRNEMMMSTKHWIC